MIVCKCIQKERDKNGKILRYALQDATGHIAIIDSDNLKQRIKFKEIDVINLLLTTDNRLVDKDISGPLKIEETDKFTCSHSMSERDFMAANGYAIQSNTKPLTGWMDKDNDEYHEPIYGLAGGVLEVGKREWRIRLRPAQRERVGVWVNHGFEISGSSYEKFKSNVLKTYKKAKDKAEANPKDTWEFEGDYNTLYKYSPGYSCKGTVKVWLRMSQIWLESDIDLINFFNKLDPCKERVNQIREIKGWQTKKQAPVMKSDGTIETRGNWFNKLFGRK